MPTVPAIATCLELSLTLIGLGLLWRFGLSPTARRQPSIAALPRWEAPPSDFFLFLWLLVAGGAIATVSSSYAVKFYSPGSDATVAVITATGQLGMLAGMMVYRVFFDHHRQPRPPHGSGFFWAGVVTFLISLPIALAVSIAWQALLTLCGLPAEKQDLIRMFREADSPALLAVMIVLACIGAPVVEELVFRAGLFRYARTRLPRWAALLLPACLFGALHGYLSSFVPLLVLGVIFSLAYERTGNIRVSMVAHALFNLNAIVLVFANVDV